MKFTIRRHIIVYVYCIVYCILNKLYKNSKCMRTGTVMYVHDIVFRYSVYTKMRLQIIVEWTEFRECTQYTTTSILSTDAYTIYSYFMALYWLR